MIDPETWPGQQVDPGNAAPPPGGPSPVFVVPDPGAARERSLEDSAESRANAAEARANRGEGRAVENDQFGRVSSLRTEFMRLPEVQNFREVQANASQIIALAGREGSAMGDLGLVFSFMKTLDPGSTVREGEQASAQNAAGVPERIRNAYNNLVSGQGLNPTQRADMAQIATTLLNSRAQQYNEVAGIYQGLLQAEGVDPAQHGVVLFEMPEAPAVTQAEPRIATTEDAIRGGAEMRFGMDSWGEDSVFDRNAYLQERYGLSQNDEARLLASINALGRSATPQQVEAIYRAFGQTGDYARMAQLLREGREIGPVPTGNAEQAYINNLRQAAQGTPAEDYGLGALALQGAAFGFGDEIQGALNAVADPMNAGLAYQTGRDLERLALQDAREREGVGGVVAEIGGGLLTGGARVVPATMRAANPARAVVQEATAAGALAGYGYGEGAQGSLAGAGIGAVTGNLVGRGVNAISSRLAARGGNQAGRATSDAGQAGPPSQRVDVSTTPSASRAQEAGQELPTASPAQAEEAAILARRAVGAGLGARAARVQLAQEAKTNPEAAAAAERLGVELPLDVLSDSAQLRSLEGLARSQVGSDAETAWQQVVSTVANRADEVIAEIGGIGDLAQVSDDVFARLSRTATELEQTAAGLRSEVTAAVPNGARVDTPSLQREVAQLIGDYGGLDEAKAAMTPQERSLLRLLGEGEEALRPTYARLNRMRDDMGEALSKNKGPWADTNRNQLSRYYGAIADDQLAAVETIAGAEIAEKQRAANSLFARMFDQRAEMQNLFGRDLDRGLAPLINRALSSGANGDAKELNRLLSRLPDEMVRPVLLSGIFQQARSRASHGGFSFANYAGFYRNLRRNKPIYQSMARALGPENTRILQDLYTISSRMAASDGAVLRTGKANQGMAAVLNMETILGRVFSVARDRTALAGGASVGGLFGGPVGAAIGGALGEVAQQSMSRAGVSRLDKVHNLLSSPQFRELTESVARGEAPENSFDRLWSSPAFHRLAKASGQLSVESRREWLRGLLSRQGAVTANILEFPQTIAGTVRADPPSLAAQTDQDQSEAQISEEGETR